MKIFVTGATGFIGSSLIKQLSNSFDNVYGIHRAQNLRKPLLLTPNLVELDFSSAKINAFFNENRPEVLIHCIGSPTVGWAQDNPFLDYLSAVNSVSVILEAIRLHSPNCHLILISSAAVYGNQDANLLREDLELRPCSIYGFNKALAEQITMNYVSFYGLKASIIRPFSVYGPGLRKQVVFDLLSKFNNNQSGFIEIIGTGMESRDFIHINDVVSGVCEIIRAGNSGTINLGTGIATNLKELVTMIQGLTNQSTDFKFLGGVNEWDPPRLIADTRRALQIGISPNIDIASGLEDTLRHLKNEI